MLEIETEPEIRFRDPALEPVWEKVAAGERLSEAEGLSCLGTQDLIGLGRMADYVARRRSGDRVYFTFNVHVNPTNVCVLSCKFCDFQAKPGDEHAYEFSIEDIVGRTDMLAQVSRGSPHLDDLDLNPLLVQADSGGAPRFCTLEGRNEVPDTLHYKNDPRIGDVVWTSVTQLMREQ